MFGEIVRAPNFKAHEYALHMSYKVAVICWLLRHRAGWTGTSNRNALAVQPECRFQRTSAVTGRGTAGYTKRKTVLLWRRACDNDASGHPCGEEFVCVCVFGSVCK